MRRLTNLSGGFSNVARMVALAAIAALAACAPEQPGGDDDAPPADCESGETRCVATSYQECVDGTFVTLETCSGTCSPTTGCTDCVPGVNSCSGNDVVSCNADGTYGPVVEACSGGEQCMAGECTRACTADGVDLIYIVDETYRLLSFDPRKLDNGMDPFELVGQLACNPTMGNVPGWGNIEVTPFSMSVDREGTAWVLYTSGEIFKVSTQDAGCQASGYTARQNNMLLFGMGFVTDSVGGNTETLFAGGGDPDAESANRRLSSIDPTSLANTVIGPMSEPSQYSAELTGTGAAELFGFYPGVANAFVQQIDKTTGAGIGQHYDIPGGLGGTVQAWAFAQWGGKFYIFVTTTDGFNSNSTVQVIDKATNTHSVALQNLDYIIVGAGVSTCAPTEIE